MFTDEANLLVSNESLPGLGAQSQQFVEQHPARFQGQRPQSGLAVVAEQNGASPVFITKGHSVLPSL